MTVTVIPISQSSTATHDFQTITNGGRRMTIIVEANTDVSDEAVLEDLEASLAPHSQKHLTPAAEMGSLPILAKLFVMWLCTGVGVGLILFLCMLAGWDTFGGYNSYRFPAQWPKFFSEQTIGTVLLRVHLLLLAVILLVAAIDALLSKRRSASA